MAKFYGLIGFTTGEKEISPGVWDHEIVERPYRGEVVRETLEIVGGQSVLGESKTANSFNIVADPFATQNFFDMLYVKWGGKYWAVRQVELRQRPRMLVRIGGIWNGPIFSSIVADPP